MPAESLKLPEQVGRYRIVGKLASGGMAEILIGALDGAEGFARAVVVKRVLAKFARRADFRRMFIDEARIVSGLRHANVVSVLELGQDAGALYLVMEYLEGESLDVLIKRLRKTNERLPPSLAAHVVAEACAGLHAAHELKDSSGVALEVIHRDVSPQNLFLGYDGSVKVIDFGIAKAVNRETKTQTGTVKGKFAYMSPEQIDGKHVDRRLDVFALGVVLFELLTFQRLFARPNQLEIVKAICFEPIPSPRDVAPDVPEVLDAVARRALSRDPDERYATAADMRRDLLAALRSLTPDAIHEEELAATMREVFGARIEEKRDLMRLIAKGGAIGSFPRDMDSYDELELESYDADDLPTSLEDSSRVNAKTPTTGRVQRGRAPLAIAAVAVLVVLALAIGVVAVWSPWTSPASPPEPRTSPREVALAPPPEPVQAPAPPATITVHVETRPPGATVQIEGHEPAQTPADLSLPRGDTPMALTVSLEGHQDATEQIVPNVDQRISLTLERVRAPRVRREAREEAPAPARTRPIFRMD